MRAPDLTARRAYRLVIAAGLLVMLAVNLPGHLSTDSVIALHQGRTGVRETWAPAVVSWILGRFDAVSPGAGLYVTASGALLYLSLLSLADLRARTSWAAPVLALVAALTPQLLVYQGIVWKDVLFANLAVAGFIWLAHAVTGAGWRAAASLCGAILCLALAVLVRQNGVVAAVFAGVAIAAAVPRRWPVRLGLGLAVLVAALGLAVLIGKAVEPQRSAPKLRADAGLRVLQHYDVVGVVARDPHIHLDEIAAARPDNAAEIRKDAVAYYSAQRVDMLDTNPVFRRALWKTPDAAMAAQWRAVVLEDPLVYIHHRAGASRWLLAPPDLRQCLPVHTGVEGPQAMLDDLGLSPRATTGDRDLAAYAARFFDTPVYSHVTYAILAAAVALLALRRRDRADLVMACMMGAALAFTATFFLISVACDYRYLYLLDLAAITGVLYLALEPPFGAGRQRTRAA